MGSVLDVARCEELSLLRGRWYSFDRVLNVRDARRGDSNAPRNRLQRFIRRAPQQVDGGLVRVAVRTSEDGGHVLEDFVWREAGGVGLESGNVRQRRALHESVDAFTELGAAKNDLAPQVLPRHRLMDPLGHEASGGGPSCRHGAIEGATKRGVFSQRQTCSTSVAGCSERPSFSPAHPSAPRRAVPRARPQQAKRRRVAHFHPAHPSPVGTGIVPGRTVSL
jgi:hypothetical protein